MGIRDIGFDEETTPPSKDPCDIYYDSFYIYEDMIEIMSDILSNANHDLTQTKVCKDEFVVEHLADIGITTKVSVSPCNIVDILIQCKRDECEAVLIDLSDSYQDKIEAKVSNYKKELKHHKRHPMYTKHLHQTNEIAEMIPYMIEFTIAFIFKDICALQIDVEKVFSGFNSHTPNLDITYDIKFTEIISEGIRNNNRYVKMMRQLHRQTYEKTIVVGDGMNPIQKHAVESAVSKIFRSN